MTDGALHPPQSARKVLTAARSICFVALQLILGCQQLTVRVENIRE